MCIGAGCLTRSPGCLKCPGAQCRDQDVTVRGSWPAFCSTSLPSVRLCPTQCPPRVLQGRGEAAVPPSWSPCTRLGPQPPRVLAKDPEAPHDPEVPRESPQAARARPHGPAGTCPVEVPHFTDKLNAPATLALGT